MVVGRVRNVPPHPSLGLEDPKLGAAISKAGVPPCIDCNGGVLYIFQPPIGSSGAPSG